MSLEVTSAPMLAVDSAQERSQHRGAGEQSWEVKQHRILTGSLEHLNHILPKVSVNSAVLGSPGGRDSEESACNAGDLSSFPGLGRSPGEGNGDPPQYSCLDNLQGQRSLEGCSLRGCKESDTTEMTKHNQV